MSIQAVDVDAVSVLTLAAGDMLDVEIALCGSAIRDAAADVTRALLRLWFRILGAAADAGIIR